MANAILEILSPFYTERPPLAIEKDPPTKSKIMLKIDHPLVLFLL
jgi:hypothetical protein